MYKKIKGLQKQSSSGGIVKESNLPRQLLTSHLQAESTPATHPTPRLFCYIAIIPQNCKQSNQSLQFCVFLYIKKTFLYFLSSKNIFKSLCDNFKLLVTQKCACVNEHSVFMYASYDRCTVTSQFLFQFRCRNF